MDRSVRRPVGKIRSLAGVLRDHPEAIRYDLLAIGLRLEDLGTPALTWLDLAAVIEQGPAGSATNRALHGEDALWGIPELLLAAAVDRLSLQLWQNSGGKGRRPKPIARPGVKSSQKSSASRKLDALTVDEYERRYAERQAKQRSE